MFLKVMPSGSLQLIGICFVFDQHADRSTLDDLDHRIQVGLSVDQATQLMKLLGAVLFDVET